MNPLEFLLRKAEEGASGGKPPVQTLVWGERQEKVQHEHTKIFSTPPPWPQKVRCGPATMLQPRLPSQGLHSHLRSLRVRWTVHCCSVPMFCSLSSLNRVRALPGSLWSGLYRQGNAALWPDFWSRRTYPSPPAPPCPYPPPSRVHPGWGLSKNDGSPHPPGGGGHHTTVT